ncbi:MAG: hypothetical protein ACOZCO_16930 [Bacteroidota bacterium]
MHDIEPHYNWRGLYTAEEDSRSPFYGREYSEFEYSNHIYDHYIHPQWDEFGSQTLYIKIIYADYDEGFTIIELMGEWNDLLYNDIMLLKREIVETLQAEGISKFILLGENVLNFHTSDECYYEEWFDEANENDGWIAMVNFRDHVIEDFQSANIDSYFVMGGNINEMEWRTLHPDSFYKRVKKLVQKRIEG